MSTAWKPADYPVVSPYLMVDDARRSVDFIVDVFGANERRLLERADGRIRHVEVQIGDSVIMLADSAPEWPAIPVWLHVYVEDVDAVYERALAAGATAVQPPKRNADESDRRGGFQDPAGNTWWIATREEAHR